MSLCWQLQQLSSFRFEKDWPAEMLLAKVFLAMDVLEASQNLMIIKNTLGWVYGSDAILLHVHFMLTRGIELIPKIHKA